MALKQGNLPMVLCPNVTFLVVLPSVSLDEIDELGLGDIEMDG